MSTAIFAPLGLPAAKQRRYGRVLADRLMFESEPAATILSVQLLQYVRHCLSIYGDGGVLTCAL